MKTPLEHYAERRGFKNRYIMVGNIKTHFLAEGSGPAVVLLHGLGGCAANWLDNIEVLAENHRVYAIDLPGFGLTGRFKGMTSIATFEQFLTDFMETQSISHCSLVGHSMGGLISMVFALNHQDKVDKLILVASGGLGKELSVPLRLTSVVGNAMPSQSDHNATRRLLRHVFHDPSFITDEMVDFYFAMGRLEGTKEAFMNTVRLGITLSGQRIIVKEMLPLLRVPLMIVWGAQDRVIPVAHGKQAHRMAPDSILHVFDQCGHCPQMERFSEFNQLLLSFLGTPYMLPEELSKPLDIFFESPGTNGHKKVEIKG